MSKRFIIPALAAFALLAWGCGGKEPTEVDIPSVFPINGGENNQNQNTQASDPVKVDCKKTVSTGSWTTYLAYTIDCIQGFNPNADPETDKYGGWLIKADNPDGFFRVMKASNGRYWMVDPEGNLFLSKGLAVFSPGSSDRQKEKIIEKFGPSNPNTNWAKAEAQFIREQGFNSAGAWSMVDIIKNIPEPLPYTVILSPMGSYIGELKNSSDATLKAAFKAAGWEGYPYDFAMVFDERFDQHVESTISKASQYKNDKFLIGYFIDNEIPWKDYALEYCLTKWPSTHINHQKAQTWLDQRKGKSGCTISDATTDDKKAFIAYCYDVYLQKVTTALKKYDPNHLFLGNRFNQWNYELVNPEMFKTAGKYVDVVSINHYQKWEPDAEAMRNWEAWSGKPFMVTEFYTKGQDSGMGNTSGAGWVVKTQKDRGLFYQNFVNQLVKSKVCVGWHWFTYMDNDPTNTGSDSSNVDSNKGIVTWDLNRYDDCISQMRAINEHIYELARFYQ